MFQILRTEVVAIKFVAFNQAIKRSCVRVGFYISFFLQPVFLSQFMLNTTDILLET